MTVKPSLKIAAFGALNEGSYRVFASFVATRSGGRAVVSCAGPYPNAQGLSVTGRPLRAEALKDPALAHDLHRAVADDARTLGPHFNVWCMPCLSMVGFHDGIEQELGRPIVRLADALRDFYKDIPRVGVIFMRPAAQRIADIFGPRAVIPDKDELQRLIDAEKNPALIEDVMKEITLSFRDQGITHVLFARADAPQAIHGPAAQIEGLKINSYFDILADNILKDIR